MSASRDVATTGTTEETCRPPSEFDRLEVLEALDIMDSAPKAIFEDLVELAATVCKTPTALVSLVGAKRQWLKARVGSAPFETPIEQSICVHALASQEVLVIPDLSKDPRTMRNALVTGRTGLRFYAGAPLVLSEGVCIGALCVIDTAARPQGLDREQIVVLKALARQAVAHIEVRRLSSRKGELLRRQRQNNALMRASARTVIAAQEVAGIGTFELDVASGEVHVSPEFCRIFGLSRRSSVPLHELASMAHPVDRHLFSIDRIRAATDVAPEREYRFLVPTRGLRWICRHAMYERDAKGRPVKLLGTVQDVTERKRSAARIGSLLELGDRLRDLSDIEEIALTAASLMGRALEASRAGFGVVNAAQETVVVKPEWCAPGVESIAGKHRFRDYGSFIENLKKGECVVILNAATDPRTRDNHAALQRLGIHQLINVPIFDHGVLRLIVFVHHDAVFEWMQEDIAYVRSFGDRIQSAIARVHAEAEQTMLNREIGHRLKNAFAMVQALARHTLRPVTEREPVQTFERRLRALSSAHDILLVNNWGSADIRTVIGRVAESMGVAERLDIDGVDIAFGSKGALSLSLLLHELTTNAVKYGSLSDPQGRVLISWRLEGDGESEVFRLLWRESGGPPAREPKANGFGSRLISMGLLGTGGVVWRYQQQGLEVEMAAPLAKLQQVS